MYLDPINKGILSNFLTIKAMYFPALDTQDVSLGSRAGDDKLLDFTKSLRYVTTVNPSYSLQSFFCRKPRNRKIALVRKN